MIPFFSFFRRAFRFLLFILFYLKELVISNFKIAVDILTPEPRLRPGVVEIPVHLKKDLSRVVLANLISMTPGTLSLDISQDRKFLYVHVLYLGEAEDFRREVKEVLEKKIRGILE
ncbi:MAG: Na+/H+ antiporter subunit E [Calditrichia bacterium]